MKRDGSTRATFYLPDIERSSKMYSSISLYKKKILPRYFDNRLSISILGNEEKGGKFEDNLSRPSGITLGQDGKKERIRFRCLGLQVGMLTPSPLLVSI